MLSPWAQPARSQARSLEMPEFKTHRLALDTLPDWIIVGFFTGSGLISYQLTCDPAPPTTAWDTHTPSLLPCAGSIPETACVIRPSSESMVSVVPICGASAGGWNAPTVMSTPVVLNCGTLGLLGLGRNACTLIFMPVPQMSGHSMSDSVMTNPTELVSVWMAGTGVKPMVPSPLRRSVNLPVVKVLCEGHVVTGFGSVYFLIHSRSVRSACKTWRFG